MNEQPKVLVVDDDDATRKGMKTILEKESYEVLEVSNGKEAIAVVDAWGPQIDVILLDVMMPELSGFDVLEILKQNGQMSDLKIIMLTAKDQVQDKVRALSAGASDYVVKPYSREELLARIGVQVRLKRAEEALKHSEKYFRSLIENAPDMITIVKPDSTIRYCSPAIERLLGHVSEETIGGSVFDYIHPEDAEGVMRAFSEGAGSTEPTLSMELRVRHKDGSWRDVDATMCNLIDDAAVRGIVVNYRDITERKQIEQEKAKAHAELEEALRQLEASQEQLLQSAKLAAIGELVSGVAHELNNPLGAILIHSELLLEALDEEEAVDCARTINIQTERASHIVSNLLSFARKHEPKKTFIALNGWIESTLQLRAYDLNLDNITVNLDLDPDLPRTMADFNQMQQVFLNLINNAQQAISESKGRGTITIKSETDGEKIRIIFADDGPGIPAETLGRIFEPFFTTKDVGKGTGLGLSICYGIIQEHGGDIRVESTVGDGTRFIVELPVVTEEIGCAA